MDDTLPHFCPLAQEMLGESRLWDKFLRLTEVAGKLELGYSWDWRAYVDDFENDVRVIVDYAGQYALRVWQLHGYDEEKKAWMQHGRETHFLLYRRMADTLIEARSYRVFRSHVLQEVCNRGRCPLPGKRLYVWKDSHGWYTV